MRPAGPTVPPIEVDVRVAPWLSAILDGDLPIRGAGGRRPGETGVWVTTADSRPVGTLLHESLQALASRTPVELPWVSASMMPDGPVGGFRFTAPRADVAGWVDGTGSMEEMWHAADIQSRDPEPPPTDWLGSCCLRAQFGLVTQFSGPFEPGNRGQRRVFATVGLRYGSTTDAVTEVRFRVEGDSRLTVPAAAVEDRSRTGLTTGLIAAQSIRLDRWTLATNGVLPRPLPAWPARATFGVLDDRTSGLLIDTLRRDRVASRFLTQVEVGSVAPRDPDTPGAEAARALLIGRVSWRWEGPAPGMDLSTEVARYLDQDVGAALGIHHRFPNGWSLSGRAWGTVQQGEPDAGFSLRATVPLAHLADGRVQIAWRADVGPLVGERGRWPDIPDLYSESRGARLTDLFASWPPVSLRRNPGPTAGRNRLSGPKPPL